MELLGLIDALEATILSSPKVMLTNKVVMDEKKILGLIDKMRVVIKNSDKNYEEKEELFTLNTVSRNDTVDNPAPVPQDTLDDVDRILSQAKQQASEIIDSADNYAMQVLEKLHLSVLKMQRNIVKVEKTIQQSKDGIKDPVVKEEISEW